MSEIQLYQYEGRQVRTVQKDGETWFVARDVCDILEIQNITDAMSRIDEDEKSTLDSIEGGPSRLIVNESGLYSLILGSRKPEARQFKRWVTSEVLPSIRKTGSYSIVKKSEDEMVLDVITMMRDRVEKQKRLIEVQKADINRMEPKEEYFDAYLNRDGYIELSDAGKIFSTNFPQVGPLKIFPFLVGCGVLYEDRAGYHAYQNHITAGRFYTHDSSYTKDGCCFKKAKTYATSKGMAYIHSILSKTFGNGQRSLFRLSA